MRLYLFFCAVFLAMAGAFFIANKMSSHNPPPVSAPAARNQNTFARVKQSGTLRCGYYVFPPLMMRDANTRRLSGLSVDMMEKIGAAAGLKIEWTEEVDFGTWPAALKAGRFDAMCTPIWPDIPLAREAAFTRPMFYAGINAYARADDRRFDNDIEALNSPKVTLAVIEGNATYYLAQTNFRKARLLALPQNSPGGAPLENVITKKADVFFWDENGAYDFIKNNPGKIRNIDPARPVKVMPFELATDIDDLELRNLLDTALQNLEDSGYTNVLLTKWERVPGSYYRLAKPYALGGR